MFHSAEAIERIKKYWKDHDVVQPLLNELEYLRGKSMQAITSDLVLKLLTDIETLKSEVKRLTSLNEVLVETLTRQLETVEA